MKTIVRTSVLVLAISGAIAGTVSNHSAKAQQVGNFSHQVILSAMPAPACGPSTCNIRGGSN